MTTTLAGSPSESTVGHTNRAPVRRRDIQGLRALAVVLVVAFHADLPVPGGYVGVDVFFVISGFVITSLLLREQEASGRIAMRDFYARRVRRILPALAVTITLVALASTVLLSPLGPQEETARTGRAASVFVANIQLYGNPQGYFDVAAETNALLHTWSLSVEEQFYFAFPALLAAAFTLAAPSRRTPRRRVAMVLVAAATASFALSLTTTNGDLDLFADPSRWAFYSSISRAWEFLAGALLALGAARLRRLSAAPAVGLGLAGAALVGASAFLFDGATPFPGTAALLPVVGTVALIAAGTATDRGVSAVLGWRLPVRIGDLSYGWYLWHWPAVVFATAIRPGKLATVAAIASLVPAWLSLRYIETPVRSDHRWTGRRAAVLGVVCIVIPFTVCLLVVPISERLQSADTRAFVDDMRRHADVERGCDDPQPIGDRLERCTWPATNPGRGRIVLVGDSNAGQFTEPVVRAGNELGYDVTVVTMSACAFADVTFRRDGDIEQECRDFNVGTMTDLQELQPALVIVANAYHPNNNEDLIDPATGVVAKDEDKLGAYTDALESTLRQLTEAGVPSAMVVTLPHLAKFEPSTCGPETYLDPLRCNVSEPLDQVLARSAEKNATTRDAIDAVPGAVEVDLAAEVCPGQVCAAHTGDLWMYRDGGHLSVPGALTLTDEFREVIASAAAPLDAPTD